MLRQQFSEDKSIIRTSLCQKKTLHEPYNLSINSFIEVHNHVYNWIFVRTGILISCVLLHPTVAAAPKILGGPRRVRLGGPDSPQVKL